MLCLPTRDKAGRMRATTSLRASGSSCRSCDPDMRTSGVEVRYSTRRDRRGKGEYSRRSGQDPTNLKLYSSVRKATRFADCLAAGDCPSLTIVFRGPVVTLANPRDGKLHQVSPEIGAYDPVHSRSKRGLQGEEGVLQRSGDSHCLNDDIGEDVGDALPGVFPIELLDIGKDG